MNGAGFMPDASVYSCLVAAFAMNDKNSFQASQQFTMLDWNKIRRGKDPPKSIRVLPSVGTTPKMFKDAMSIFRKMGTPTAGSGSGGMGMGMGMGMGGMSSWLSPLSKAMDPRDSDGNAISDVQCKWLSQPVGLEVRGRKPEAVV